ncbi:MAG TPA: serine/threonine-protein kinase [Candidatus Hydrogenedentes bacterium]|nr:serine/threonine-protein kinase [Candidatus Hydrogenedentota bacterium]
MSSGALSIERFNLEPGRRLGAKYILGPMLGYGWEGEVYHVTEIATGIERAAKLFFPQRNPANRAVRFYATKLDKLRDCPILIQYHTQDTFVYRGTKITFLVSEYVQGELLPALIARQPGKCLQSFEGLHLLHPIAAGLEQIHRRGEYHGDLHLENVMVRRKGLGFDVKLVDIYHWGRRTREHIEDDVCSAIRLFYDAIGGAKRYASHRPEIKAICCGLKRSLIVKKFRTAGHLRRHLETMDWD